MKNRNGSAARRNSWPRPRIVIAALVSVLAACVDPTGPAGRTVPFSIEWIEWPATVTAAQPGALLVTWVPSFCSDDSLRIRVDTTVVRVISTTTPRQVICPLVPGPIFPQDILLPMPVLHSPTGPQQFALRATMADPAFDNAERMAGFIALDVASDTTRHMGGEARLEVDSAGCPTLSGGAFGLPAHVYAVSNMPALGGSARIAMVEAHVVPGAGPAGCGTRRVVQLDRADVTLVP